MNMFGKSLLVGGWGLIALLTLSPSSAETPLPSQGYAIPFTVNEYVKTDGRCVQLPKTPCTQVKITFPLFQASSQSSTAIDAINSQIQQVLLQTPSSDQPPRDIETAMTQFIQNYHNAIREFPQQGVWADEKQVEVKNNQPQLLSLQYSHYFYTGGAHPNSSRTYWNFNPKTGKSIQLSEVFVKGYAPKLNAIAEKRFREAKKIPPDASLNQAGFWFKNDKFQVNNNFLISPKGLTFFFNTYEIGPYVIGPTEIQIPYPELKELIKDRTLLPTG